MFKPAFLSLFAAVVLLLSGCEEYLPWLGGDPVGGDPVGEDTVQSAPANTVELIISDMQGPHEARPRGVPDNQEWAFNPRISMGNDPGDWQAMITWGQFYEPVEGNPATNTRVQIRDIKAYYLSKTDNEWYLWQESEVVEGAAYVENFAGDENIPADIRVEEEGVSVAPAGEGYNFHFWTPFRTPIDPDDIAGVFTTVQARLIVDDSSQPDDRDQARLILNVGGDYWATMTAEWDNWTTNADIGIGKFKFVTSQWQHFNMHTVTPELLRGNPPPLN
jgi:hypothetical protein